MTTQEKAEELYWKYYDKLMSYPYKRIKAKKFALITVDEMLLNADVIWGWDAPIKKDEFRKYWLEVKQELEKL